MMKVHQLRKNRICFLVDPIDLAVIEFKIKGFPRRRGGVVWGELSITPNLPSVVVHRLNLFSTKQEAKTAQILKVLRDEKY